MKMLWYKAWRETRARALMPLFTILFLLCQLKWGGGNVKRPDLLPALPSLWLFIPVIVAGSGLKTEPVFQQMKGLHGSTYFTLSLPVSRLRLLAVRAGVGLLEMAAIIVVVCCLTGILFPAARANISLANAYRYIVAVFLANCGLYGFATLLASLLEQPWQTWGGMAAIFLAPWLFNVTGLPASFNTFRAMGNLSPLVTHAFPWAAIGVSLGAGAIFFLAAAKIVQKWEY